MNKCIFFFGVNFACVNLRKRTAKVMCRYNIAVIVINHEQIGHLLGSFAAIHNHVTILDYGSK